MLTRITTLTSVHTHTHPHHHHIMMKVMSTRIITRWCALSSSHLIRTLLQKRPVISGSFAGNDLQLKTSYRSLSSSHLMRTLPQKRPIMSGSFAENDLQLKASYEGILWVTLIIIRWWCALSSSHLMCTLPQKRPTISGSFAENSGFFAENDLQLKASYGSLSSSHLMRTLIITSHAHSSAKEAYIYWLFCGK